MSEDNPFKVVENAKSNVAQKAEDNVAVATHQEFAFLEQMPRKYMNKKLFFAYVGVLFLLGLISGAILFGGSGSNNSAPVGPYLTGIVTNPDVPAGRRRCGTVELSQGCVAYVMNAQRREIEAKELYKIAATMTTSQMFIIETGNLRYGNTVIKPGYIAQINIPPIR